MYNESTRGDSLIKKLLLIVALGVTLSGCFIAPIALIGPATSGFSTASVMQAGISSGANYMIKKSTGKTFSEHAFDAISEDVLKQSYTNNYKNKKKIKIDSHPNY